MTPAVIDHNDSVDAMPGSVPRWMIVGPAGWRHGVEPVTGDRFVGVRLPDGPPEVNTVLVRAGDLAPAAYRVFEVGRGPVATGEFAGYPFVDLAPRPELAALVPGVRGLAPLFVLTQGREQTGLFVQVRMGSADALFVWMAEGPAVEAGGGVGDLLGACLAGAEESRRFFNNHQHYYRKFWPGYELEHKITIAADTDIYDLAVGFRNLVGFGGFPGYLWEYGDDFQQWDFDNHLFEVTHPAAEAGYISFIPDSAGKHVLKRKWFQADGVKRREQKWLSVAVEGSFAEHIDRHVGVAAGYLGTFRRTRFDISCESARTGNVYSIMIDRCRMRDGLGPDLCQVEIEYMYSRTLRDWAATHVAGEMEQLVAESTKVLAGRGVAFEYGPLSKLSYLRRLRDTNAARPSADLSRKP